jgi:hypothetical protein
MRMPSGFLVFFFDNKKGRACVLPFGFLYFEWKLFCTFLLYNFIFNKVQGFVDEG